jgi:hypothetical protein
MAESVQLNQVQMVNVHVGAIWNRKGKITSAINQPMVPNWMVRVAVKPEDCSREMQKSMHGSAFVSGESGHVGPCIHPDKESTPDIPTSADDG